jgi:hypothetical protein
MGVGAGDREDHREAIRPIEQSGRRSRFLDVQLFIMIGVCKRR